MSLPSNDIMDCKRVAHVYPILPWSREHKGVAEFDVGTSLFIKLPANVAEPTEFAISEWSILKYGDNVASQEHPHRVFGANWHNDDRKTYLSCDQVVAEEAPGCGNEKQKYRQQDGQEHWEHCEERAREAALSGLGVLKRDRRGVTWSAGEEQYAPLKRASTPPLYLYVVAQLYCCERRVC